MKKSSVIIILFCTLIIILLLFFSIDYVKAKNNQTPIFCIPITTHTDGSIEYYGFGYKVINYVYSSQSQKVVKIGSWFLKFDKPVELAVNISPNITFLKFNSINIQTHIYIDNFITPTTDIIRTVTELNSYKKKFNDSTLYDSLNKYDENYFSSMVLVIATIQENSGSNSNKVTNVVRLNDSNRLDILVENTVSQIGTADMAMWHLLVEVNKDDVKNIESISVQNSNIGYQ